MADHKALLARISELEAAQATAGILFGISRELSTARNESQLLEIVAQPTPEHGAFLVTLQYFEMDDSGHPEWSKVVASWQQMGELAVPIGTRYHLPGLPFIHHWLSEFETTLLICDMSTDERVDEATRGLYVSVGLQAATLVPLIQAGRQVGLIIYNWLESHKFTSQEVEIYRALPSLVSPVVDNLRLLTDEQAIINQLRDSEEQLRTMVDAIPIPVLITQVDDGLIKYANSHFETTFDRPVETLLGSTVLELYYNPANRQHLINTITRDGYAHDYELQFKKPDGTPFWVTLSINPITFEGATALLTVMYEITERKQAEQMMAEYSQRLEADVTRRTVELQQKSSELQAVFEALPDLYFRFDVNGTFLDINAPQGTLGLPREKLLGKRISELLPLDVAEKFNTVISEVINTQTVGQVEYTLSASYNEQYFDARLSPLPEKQVIAVVRDVTQSKRLEEELKQHRDNLEELIADRTYRLELITMLSSYLNTIMEIGPLLDTLVNQVKESFGYYHVHVYLLDEEQNILEMRAGAGEVGQQLKARGHRLQFGQGIVGMVAKNRRAFLSNNVDETENFIRNPLLPHTNSELAVSLHKGEKVLGVLDIQSEELNAFSIEDVALMQSIADQTAIALDNARLLTEQQKTILKLQEADALNQEYTRALETTTAISRQITSILDLNELLQFVVNRINTEFKFYHTHVYLVEPETDNLVMVEGFGEVGRKLKEKGHRLSAGQGIVGTVAAINQLFLSNDVNKVLNFVRNPLLPNTNSELAVPMRKGKHVLGVLDMQSEQLDRFTPEDVSLLQSIGDQIAVAVDNARLLAEQKATIIKLRELDRAKSQFLTMMSHELRTPLNAVMGFSELLLLGLSGELSDQAKDDVQLIYNNGKHLLDLINDIIDITKIEAGVSQVNIQPLDASLVIGEVLAASKLLLKEKVVEIIVDLPETLPFIQADKTRLKQILLNLVGNAIKFTHKGKVTVRAGVVDESLSAIDREPTVEDKVIFSVIDTGVGIPLDKQQIIFDAFNQADMTDTREFGGTGLGLTICKELVQMHGGQIGVKSEENVGSEFYFTIPVSEENFYEMVDY
jgi:PAS domain S-box-containing protein